MAAAHAPRPSGPAVVGWSFAAVDTAVTLAGEFAAATARRWRLGELAGAAGRVAAALVRRAVATTGQPGPLPAHLDVAALAGVGEVVLWVRRDGADRLRVAVWDRSPHGPGSGDARLAAVVAECRGRWAWYRADGGGKVVWFDITT